HPGRSPRRCPDPTSTASTGITAARAREVSADYSTRVPVFASMNEGWLSRLPCASAGRSVPARGGRPPAWMPAEFRPDGVGWAVRGRERVGGGVERCPCLYRVI